MKIRLEEPGVTHTMAKVCYSNTNKFPGFHQVSGLTNLSRMTSGLSLLLRGSNSVLSASALPAKMAVPW